MIEMPIEQFYALIVAFITISGVIIGLVRYIYKRGHSEGLNNAWKSAISEKMEKIEKQQDLFLKTILDKLIVGKLIDEFHSPHTPETDKLLEKYKSGLLEKWKSDQLSLDDMLELKQMIENHLISENLDADSPRYLYGTLLIAGLTVKIAVLAKQA